MRLPLVVVVSVVGVVLCCTTDAAAQDPPPRIGPIVVDLRGFLPNFPDSLALAQSRGLDQAALPGRGFGVDAGVHVYPLKVRMVTIGLGGQLTLARSRAAAAAPNPAVMTHFTEFGSELSLNFGSGDGWSYLSGGLGASRWSIVPDGGQPQVADQSWVRTFNYGGGARWFAKPHLAFHIDVRVHAVDPGPPQRLLPGSPRLNLLIAGAGVSIK